MFYLVEFVRVPGDGTREVVARYNIPEGVMAEVTLSDLSDDALVGELKRRWSSGSC